MNTLSIILLIVIGIAFFIALWALIVKKKGRCGGSSGCDGCPLKDTCEKKTT